MFARIASSPFHFHSFGFSVHLFSYQTSKRGQMIMMLAPDIQIHIPPMPISSLLFIPLACVFLAHQSIRHMVIFFAVMRFYDCIWFFSLWGIGSSHHSHSSNPLVFCLPFLHSFASSAIEIREREVGVDFSLAARKKSHHVIPY